MPRLLQWQMESLKMDVFTAFFLLLSSDPLLEAGQSQLQVGKSQSRVEIMAARETRNRQRQSDAPSGQPPPGVAPSAS